VARRRVVPVVVTSSTRSRSLPDAWRLALKLWRSRARRCALVRPVWRPNPRRRSSAARGLPRRLATSSASNAEASHGRLNRRHGWDGTWHTRSIPEAHGVIATAAARRLPRGGARSSRPPCLSATMAVRAAPSCSPQITVADCGGRVRRHDRHGSEPSSAGTPQRGQWRPARGTISDQQAPHRPRSEPLSG